MREIEFRMEIPDLVKPGDAVEVVEKQTPAHYYYIIEPAVAMSGCIPNNQRLKVKQGVVKSVTETPRGIQVIAEFEE